MGRSRLCPTSACRATKEAASDSDCGVGCSLVEGGVSGEEDVSDDSSEDVLGPDEVRETCVDFICFIFLNAVKGEWEYDLLCCECASVGDGGMMNWKNTPWSSSSTFSGSPELVPRLGNQTPLLRRRLAI